jgi:outer membrane protein
MMRAWPVALLFSTVLLGAGGSSPATRAAASAPDTLALSLEESVKLALSNNKDLKVIEEKVREAQSRVDETGTSFFPKLTASAGYTRLDVAPFLPTSRFSSLFGAFAPANLPREIQIGIVDNYSTSLRLEQPLFTGGKLANNYEITRLDERNAETDLRRASDELVFEVERSYFGCVKALKYEVVAGQSVKELGAHLKDVQARYDEGLAAMNDVLKAKVYLSQAQLGLMKAGHAVKLARKSFCNLVSLPLESEVSFTTAADTVAPAPVDLDAALRMALERRPELRGIGFEKMIARKSVDIARSGYLPDVSFFANLGYQYPDRNFARDFYTDWSLGFVAQLSVFDWGRTAYRAQEARSRLAQVEMSERSLRDAVTLDVTRTHLALTEAFREIDVAREAVAQAEENYRVTGDRLKEGLATDTDLLDAEVLLTSARISLSDALVDCVIARADLVRATGGPGG